jgi:hypothetical protein
VSKEKNPDPGFRSPLPPIVLFSMVEWDAGELSLPLDTAWSIYEVMNISGFERSYHFARSVNTFAYIGERDKYKLINDEVLLQMWESFADRFDVRTHPWEEHLDRVVHFTYVLLREKQINRSQAAEIASLLLEKPISTEAWRKRVDRWVEKHQLPKVGLPRRSKRRSSTREG